MNTRWFTEICSWNSSKTEIKEKTENKFGKETKTICIFNSISNYWKKDIGMFSDRNYKIRIFYTKVHVINNRIMIKIFQFPEHNSRVTFRNYEESDGLLDHWWKIWVWNSKTIIGIVDPNKACITLKSIFLK